MTTQTITVNSERWVAVTTGTTKIGCIENHASATVLFRFDVTAPERGVVTGHQLKMEQVMNWACEPGQLIFARTLSVTGTLVVTEGVSVSRRD